jgi:hypothetical protein
MPINSDGQPDGSGGLLTRILSVLAAVLALGLALMFSVVVFVVIAVAGSVLWLYFWWKTRELRRRIKEQADLAGHAANSARDFPEPQSSGEIIEGEAVRVVDDRKQISE